MSVTDSEIASFIAQHRRLLARERDEEIKRSSLLLSNCGPKLLEQKGLSLAGLGVVGINIGLGGKTLVELERTTALHSNPVFPPHTFRPGDLARIEANVTASSQVKKAKKGGTDDVKATQCEGVVYKVSDTRIVVAVDSSESRGAEDLDLPERCRVLKIANSVTYERMEKALDELERRMIGSGSKTDGKSQEIPTRLMQVLIGQFMPSKRMSLKEIDFFDETLNSSQKEAVRFCLESPEVACIHGPPGTGKTHTLVEVIRQMTQVTAVNTKPLRLLVCGASNLSVDNILERLLNLPPNDKSEKIHVTRIGHPARVMAQEKILESTLEIKSTRTEEALLAKDVKNELESALNLLSGKGKGAKGKAPRGAERRKLWDEVKALRKEYRQREGGVVKSVLSRSQVVLATCHSSGGRQLRYEEFDVLIIDEATQALEAVCWIPIFKAKKLILAGDPMQLPPTILSIDADRKAKASLPSAKGKSSDRKKKDLHASKVPNGRVDAGTAPDSESSSEGNAESSIQETKGAPLRKRSLRPPRTLETTLFDRLERMYGPGIKRMLEIQYRMHEQICSFPSETLYHAKLKSHTSVAHHLLQDLPNVKEAFKEEEKDTLTVPVVFFDTAGCEYFERLDGDADEGSRCNENEATIVKNWVEKLVATGILPEQIAVITPYQAQVTLLTSLLRPTYGTGLEIGTVDGMQGREKEAIIISLVRSNENREVGFLKDKRRMNVAMTRARRHLVSIHSKYTSASKRLEYSRQCVVGDSSTVTHGSPYLKKWMTWLEANADVRYAGLD